MHQKRIHLTNAKTMVTIIADSIPAKAAIDPRHILIDRVYDDNIKKVKID
jgi:ABC-2 type transport system permease protein